MDKKVAEKLEEKKAKKPKEKDVPYISKAYLDRLQIFEDTIVPQFKEFGDTTVAKTM